MNSPFTALPALPAVSAAVPGTGINADVLQGDTGKSGGFAGLLDGIYAAATPLPADAATATLDGEALLAGLQELPQGGKLLPLLQQTLDGVAAGAASGSIDPEPFARRLIAALKTLLRDATATSVDQSPAETLAQVLQPLVQQQPALRSVLPAEITAALDRLAGQGGSARDELLVRGMPALAQHRTADSGTLSPQAGDSAAVVRDVARPYLSDAGVLAPQSQPAANDSRAPAAEFTSLMNAIRRLSPESARPVSSESSVVAAAHSAASGAAPASAPAQAATPAVALNTPLGQADWDQALGERIQWLASQKMQGAQVKLNPAHLGPMEVRIQVQNDQATVHFSSHHAVVRDALEAALPRLRDMFEASGVELVNVDISGGSNTGQQRAMQDFAAPQWGAAGGPDADEAGAMNTHQTPLATFLANGRLDLFA